MKINGWVWLLSSSSSRCTMWTRLKSPALSQFLRGGWSSLPSPFVAARLCSPSLLFSDPSHFISSIGLHANNKCHFFSCREGTASGRAGEVSAAAVRARPLWPGRVVRLVSIDTPRIKPPSPPPNQKSEISHWLFSMSHSSHGNVRLGEELLLCTSGLGKCERIRARIHLLPAYGAIPKEPRMALIG